MSFTTPESNAIPIWVTPRDSSGALSGAIDGLSLTIGSGGEQPISWDGELGLCCYPLDTTACPSPQSLNITTSNAAITTTSTSPASVQELLPSGYTLLSNVVCSQTCLHFVAENLTTGAIALASFRPSDKPAEDATAIVWSSIPSFTNTPVSIRLGIYNTLIIVSVATGSDTQSYTGTTPEVINGSLAATTLALLSQTPGVSGNLLYATIFDSRPLLIYNLNEATNIWLPSAANKTGISYQLAPPSGCKLLTITSATLAPATSTTPPTAWLSGSADSSAILIQVPLTTTIPTYVLNSKATDTTWTGLSVTPGGVFVSGNSGAWQYTGGSWVGYGGSPALGILTTVWSTGNPWTPLPGAPTPITLGLHILVSRTINIQNSTNGLTQKSLLTTEHLMLASLDETPSWLTDSTITPVVLASPIWDDRAIFDAPDHPLGETAPLFQYLIPGPALSTITSISASLNPLDPTGTLLINLNPTPSPVWTPSGIALFTDSQIYTYPYPTTKMSYPALTVLAPRPSIATVNISEFPTGDLQKNLTGTASGTTTAVKAIISGSYIYISLIALNTSSVYIGSSTTSLPPVLIDYATGLLSGQTSLVITLNNQDYSIPVTVPITSV